MKQILSPAISLFILRELPFARFDFQRWQSLLAISLIGVLIGLDPSLRAVPPDMPDVPVPPLWLAIGVGLVAVWVSFLLILLVLRWWLKRAERWDGQGDLFDLLAASWLVASVLGAVAVAAGVPPLLTLPLYLYAIWVGANALSGAIPKASLGYCIAGILISLIPATLVSGLIVGLAAAFTMATLGPA